MILLVIQYVLGLGNNLYGTAPTATRDITEFSIARTPTTVQVAV